MMVMKRVVGYWIHENCRLREPTRCRCASGISIILQHHDVVILTAPKNFVRQRIIEQMLVLPNSQQSVDIYFDRKPVVGKETLTMMHDQNATNGCATGLSFHAGSNVIMFHSVQLAEDCPPSRTFWIKVPSHH